GTAHPGTPGASWPPANNPSPITARVPRSTTRMIASTWMGRGSAKSFLTVGGCATRRLWAGSGAGTVLVVIMAIPMPARFTTGGPCPRPHHHGLTLLSATLLDWPGAPPWRGRGYLWGGPHVVLRS